MKKYLPKLIVITLLLTSFFWLFSSQVRAQDAADWVADKEVTFSGKIATRSKDLLNWVIEHYQWGYINSEIGNPFDGIWISIRGIVLGVMALFILVAAYLIITSRGKSLTVIKFIPRFIIVVILIFFSFTIVKFLFEVTDIIQGFFLKVNFRDTPKYISDLDLLHISFDYKDFVGYRRIGDEFDEAVFVSTLMVKLTAITYYAMFVILIIRKIILWFFLVVSPIFPLLLMFYPLRNTAKVWTGEFFRWLLYGPLFAVFLAGLVSLWRIYIPLNLNLPNDNPPTSEDDLKYPTAISILLGGPKQQVTLYNSLNTPDTFIQYIVALLMLWMVIIVPFILLKIFLDYFKDMNFSESNMVKYLVNQGSPLINRYRFGGGGGGGGGPVPPGQGGGPAGSVGKAMELPRGEVSTALSPAISEVQMHMQQTAQRTQQMAEAYRNASQQSSALNSAYSTAFNQAYSQASSETYNQVQNIASTAATQAIADILRSTNLSVPTMRDVVKYESALMSHGGGASGSAHSEANRVFETLNRISGSSNLVSAGEKDKFVAVRNQLVQESKKGNAVASSILSASMPSSSATIPERNRVQKVTVEDYEEVKKLWIENYRKMDVPSNADGSTKTRKQWVQEETNQIPQVIDLLTSTDAEKVNKGKELVAKVLPFLLLGGFSKEEIITYLKAKLEAAKQVFGEIMENEKVEEESVEIERKIEEKPKLMQMSAEEDKPKELGAQEPPKTPEPLKPMEPKDPNDDSLSVLIAKNDDDKTNS